MSKLPVLQLKKMVGVKIDTSYNACYDINYVKVVSGKTSYLSEWKSVGKNDRGLM